MRQSGEIPACVRFWGEARARYPGYDHVVHVDNDCRGRAHCRVSTNIDPDPIYVVVDAGDQVAVVVRRGSPAREFVPRVTCDLEGPETAGLAFLNPGALARRSGERGLP